jgi:hypothetical protein
MDLGQLTNEAKFYDISFVRLGPRNNNENNTKIISFALEIDAASVQYDRQVYGLVKLLGDLGGVIEILVVMMGVLIFPYSAISY